MFVGGSDKIVGLGGVLWRKGRLVGGREGLVGADFFYSRFLWRKSRGVGVWIMFHVYMMDGREETGLYICKVSFSGKEGTVRSLF